MKKLLYAILAVMLVLVARTGLPNSVTYENLSIRDEARGVDKAAARLLLAVVKPVVHDYVIFKTAEWKGMTLVCLPFGKWASL